MTSTDRPSVRSARKLFQELDGLPDEQFKQSLAGLARRLGERAKQGPNDPQAAALARRAALAVYDLARARRVKTALAAGGAVALCAGLAWFIVALAGREQAPSAVVSPTVAAAPPLVDEPVVENAQADPAAASVEQTTAAPASMSAPLGRNEVREIQARLRGFGFQPGPVDGAAGPRTQAAVLRYRQEREMAQTGDVDRALLEELRRDAAPQVAQRAAPPRGMPPPPPRRAPDPFTAALWRMERWFQTGR